MSSYKDDNIFSQYDFDKAEIATLENVQKYLADSKLRNVSSDDVLQDLDAYLDYCIINRGMFIDEMFAAE